MKTVFIPTRFKDPLPAGAPEQGALLEESGGNTEMKPARRWPDGRIEVADVKQTLSGFFQATEEIDSDESDDGSELEMAAMALVVEARRAAQTLEAADRLEGGPSDWSRLATSLREAANDVDRALDASEKET